MKYAVNCSFNETNFIDASDREDAAELAIEMFEAEYGLAPGQSAVESIQEIK